MSEPHDIQTYAAVGLSPADRAQLALLFESGVVEGVRHQPAQGDGRPAFLVINADDRHALDDLRDLDPAPCVVLIGHTHWGTGWPVVPRPITAPALATAMRQLAPLLPPAAPAFAHTSARAALQADAGSAPPTMASLAARPSRDELRAAYAVTTPSLPPDMADSSIHAVLRTRQGASSGTAPDEADAPATVVDVSRADPDAGPSTRGDARATLSAAPGSLLARASAPAPHAAFDDARGGAQAAGSLLAQILIVAEFGTRSHTLPRGLRSLGYAVDTANGEAQALALLPTKAYRIVFLDQASLGSALWGLAKQMLAGRTLAGQPPHVAIVARRQGPLDRWRAHRIGCDAWMNVPLERERLIAFLARRGVRPLAGA